MAAYVVKNLEILGHQSRWLVFLTFYELWPTALFSGVNEGMPHNTSKKTLNWRAEKGLNW